MPARKPQRPATRAQLIGRAGDVKPEDLPRWLADVQRAVTSLEGRAKDRAAIVADLFVGDTVITHGLGRTPAGASVTPTTASAAWAWAVTAKDAKQLTITTVGVDQLAATVEVH